MRYLSCGRKCYGPPRRHLAISVVAVGGAAVPLESSGQGMGMQLPSYNAQQRITELRMSTVLKLASGTSLRGPVTSQGGRRKANFFPLRSLFLAQESLCHSVSWRQNYFLESRSVPGSRMLPSGLHLPRMLTNACSGRESSRHDTFSFLFSINLVP